MMPRSNSVLFFVYLLISVVFGRLAIAQDEGWAPPGIASRAAASIAESTIEGHIRFLSDDLLEGRGPATRGDLLGQLYVESRFRELGLKPAGENGTWKQSVPLVGVTTTCPSTVAFKTPEGVFPVTFYEDYIGVSGLQQEEVSVQDAEVVFVGYGIRAPEYGWDDFKGMDLKGKILLMMNNDPAEDPERFEGVKRLYYGRWDYKYESAARQGAAGAIIIHTTESAGYPYQVVQTSWTGEQFELRGSQAPRVAFKGWVTDPVAKQLVAKSGYDLDQLREQAQSVDFQPVPLGSTFSIDMDCQIRQQDTANVLGLLPGSDPELSDEVVVYMAHHDHIGVAAQRNEEGDMIYNGAIDNASGLASMLAIAEAYHELESAPKRSILFAAVGAEEQGLLGSLHFAENPTIPAGKQAAVVNIDGISFLGATFDINVIGLGKSSLDLFVENAARFQNRIVTPDHFPDRGYYYRSDQFSLAKIGVPGVYLHAGVNVRGKPEGWGAEQQELWVEKHYHQPSDEFSEDWDLSGAVEDAQLLFYVGWQILDSPTMPEWVPGDEFESARIQAIAELQAAD